MADSRDLYGRSVIYSDVEEITSENVIDVLNDSLETHETNQSDIDYLYEYYKGNQPIKNRTKEFNDNINNKIVENIAYEITSFFTGYILSAELQYISARDTDNSEDLSQLTRWNMSENKSSSDQFITEWFLICGTAYRAVLEKESVLDESEAPYEICDLDPRYTFVVYSSKLGHKPLMAVTYITTVDDETEIYTCYTPTQIFTIKDDTITDTQTHSLGMIPIIEYQGNNSLLGIFETVVPLLDSINLAESNRMDGIEQFIQAILVMKGFDIDENEQGSFMTKLREFGGLQLPVDGSAEYLTLELNQSESQTFVDNLYNSVLTICGMPNRQMNSGSTADTGSAILLRDGWNETEARARIIENSFKKSERQFLKALITYANNLGGTNLLLNEVDIRFPRRNYTNDSSKVSNLIAMLSCDWIAPRVAFEHSDMFPDPHSAYLESLQWRDEAEVAQVNSLLDENYSQNEAEKNTISDEESLNAQDSNKTNTVL